MESARDAVNLMMSVPVTKYRVHISPRNRFKSRQSRPLNFEAEEGDQQRNRKFQKREKGNEIV